LRPSRDDPFFRFHRRTGETSFDPDFWEQFLAFVSHTGEPKPDLMQMPKSKTERNAMNSTPKPISVSECFAQFSAAGLAASTTRFLFLLFSLGAVCAVHAQGITAGAQISGQPSGGGAYDYTITLNNANSSLSPIATFWYSWVPGADFLPTSPTSVQAPTGWTYSIQGGPYYSYGYYYPDGYSIEFTTATSPLAPGSSLNFGFMSSDSPSALAGDSPWYPGNLVGTSYVFSGVGESGNNFEFLVQSVPEPSSPGLLAAGAVGLLVARWRRRKPLDGDLARRTESSALAVR
jgi:PEP-CTERM motif-containing protein